MFPQLLMVASFNDCHFSQLINFAMQTELDLDYIIFWRVCVYVLFYFFKCAYVFCVYVYVFLLF